MSFIRRGRQPSRKVRFVQQKKGSFRSRRESFVPLKERKLISLRESRLGNLRLNFSSKKRFLGDFENLQKQAIFLVVLDFGSGRKILVRPFRIEWDSRHPISRDLVLAPSSSGVVILRRNEEFPNGRTNEPLVRLEDLFEIPLVGSPNGHPPRVVARPGRFCTGSFRIKEKDFASRVPPRQPEAQFLVKKWSKNRPRDYEKTQNRIIPLSNAIVGVQFDEIRFSAMILRRHGPAAKQNEPFLAALNNGQLVSYLGTWGGSPFVRHIQQKR